MSAAQHVLLLGLRLYRNVGSPLKTLLCGPLGQCRFTPSCSEYAAQAVRAHGAMKGAWLAVRRVARCHPWGGCGEDPVPGLNPKSEIRNPKEIRRPKSEAGAPAALQAVSACCASRHDAKEIFGSRISAFFRISDFGLRISPRSEGRISEPGLQISKRQD